MIGEKFRHPHARKRVWPAVLWLKVAKNMCSAPFVLPIDYGANKTSVTKELN